MRFISWNVNGIRAALKKDFYESFRQLDADIFCIQESKCSEGQVNLELPGYHQFWNYAEKKGYSGTAIFTRLPYLSVTQGIHLDDHNKEGRVITLEMEDFYLVTVYTPNAQDGLRRLDYRMDWEIAFRNYLLDLWKKKPVIVCGDLNVAHQEIDLANPASNHKNPGFSDEEREKFSQLLASGFIDSFRHFYPDKTEAYSWWSYRTKARERNVGWRIDYFLTSKDLENRMVDAKIHQEIYGSDHCPVELELH